MKSVWKNPWFLIGFIFITGILIASFVYSGVTDNQVPKYRWIYDADGKIIGGSPQPPSWKTPLGTDKLGYDMFAKAIMGAKYTILAAISVAALRILVAVPIGMVMGVYFKKGKRYVNGFIDSFHFIPFTILAYYLLHPILWMPQGGFQTSMFERIALEVIILALLTVPVISVLISNEAGRVIEQEFVLASRTLGAGKMRLIFKHVFPALREKVFVLFGQQMMQTLIVFAHLGLLQLFLGGTKVSYDPYFGDPPQTISNEWSGLIGDTYKLLEWIPWVPLTPIVCFALTMIAVSFMIEGYVQSTTGHSHYFKKGKRKKKKPEAALAAKEIAKPEELQLYRKSS
ncbi:ABC transporter permease [Falsibacillus pallidus]|uniref:Peptide/nickel transport system permease protein n=1 Tax=Falsibacillus pallidus TaxID=493781 RepID=A0A370GDS7_9BACI|nr:ABC transporter permease subunit [Falsibacillus pallidus]RDI41948.1 peptide/nickel transport system permease protein [Falsibacillus pallidus]